MEEFHKELKGDDFENKLPRIYLVIQKCMKL